MSAGAVQPDGSAGSRATTAAVASLVAATLFWGGNYVVGAAAVATVNPLALVLLRWLIALVPLLVLAQVLERPDWGAALRSWPRLLALATVGLTGYNLLLYAALEHTSSVNASLVNAFNPALISLAAVAVLRERLSGLAWSGTVLALGGVLVLLTRGDVTGLLHHGVGTGELLMVGAICAWTGYTLLGRTLGAVPPVTATALQAALTVLVLAPLTVATGQLAWPTTSRAALALIFIGIFPSVLSYLLWNRALRRIPPGRAGVFLNLITVFTVVIGLLRGQALTPAQVLGGLLVLAGVVLTQERALRADGTARPGASTAEGRSRSEVPRRRARFTARWRRTRGSVRGGTRRARPATGRTRRRG